jgi:hypothetical protein
MPLSAHATREPHLRTKWRRRIAVCALILLFIAPFQAANARSVSRLEQRAFGCADISDIEKLFRMTRELPEGDSKNEAIRKYATARCVELPRGTVIYDDSDSDYVCVHDRQHRCLWVPRRSFRATGLDDGVF